MVGNVATCTAPAAPATIGVSGTITDKDDGSTTYTSAPSHITVVSALGVVITPASHPFGDVVVGQSSPEVEFTLTNNTNSSYDVDQVGFFVTATSHFGIADDACSGGTLSPAESCTFDAVFTPQSTGAKSTTLGVLFDGLQPPNPKPQSALTGTGVAPDASIDPVTNAFGDVTVGGSASTTFTVGNDGTSDLHISSIGISGSARFSVTGGTCTAPGTVLPAGPDCTIEVTYAPLSAVASNGSLVVVTDGGTVSATLSGTGVAGAAPIASLPAGPIDFGTVVIGSSNPEDVTLTNTGNAPLTVNSISITGSGAFTVEAGQCPDPIAPLGTCLISVVFTPTSTGARAATLRVSSNGGSPSVALQGVGEAAPAPVASLSPTDKDFLVDPLPGDDVKTFTVTNTGTGSLQVGTPTTTGSTWFSVTDFTDCAGPLLNGETCDIEVTFAPPIRRQARTASFGCRPTASMGW